MGGKAICVGIVGNDSNARVLKRQLKKQRIADSGVVVDPNRPTIIKTRHTALVHQMLRVDREHRVSIEGRVLNQVLRRIPRLMDEVKLVIVSDYGKGTLCKPLLELIIRCAKKRQIRVLVDPKGRDFRRYRGASIITPNRAEAEAATGISVQEDRDLPRVAKKLIHDVKLEAALITLGSEGVFYRTREGEKRYIPTQARAVFDVTGAGDTVISHLGLFLGPGSKFGRICPIG